MTSAAGRKRRVPGHAGPARLRGRGGAYVLHILLTDEVTIRLNRRTGSVRLAPGRYVYFGSARSGIGARVAHHRGVARGERPGRHWHIDRLLGLSSVAITKAVAHPGGDECDLCRDRKRRGGVTVPVRGFGAADCRRGCGAHLLKLRS